MYHCFCTLTSGISTDSQCLLRKTALSCSCDQYSLMYSKNCPNNKAVHPYTESVPARLHGDTKKHKAPDQGEQVNYGLQASHPCMLEFPIFSSVSDICGKPHTTACSMCCPTNLNSALSASGAVCNMGSHRGGSAVGCRRGRIWLPAASKKRKRKKGQFTHTLVTQVI